MFAPAETQFLIVELLVLVLLAAPFIGLQRAARRRRLKRLSHGAVALAGVASIAASVLSALLARQVGSASELLGAIGLVVANLAWLIVALHTNREVSRRLSARG